MVSRMTETCACSSRAHCASGMPHPTKPQSANSLKHLCLPPLPSQPPFCDHPTPYLGGSGAQAGDQGGGRAEPQACIKMSPKSLQAALSALPKKPPEASCCTQPCCMRFCPAAGAGDAHHRGQGGHGAVPAHAGVARGGKAGEAQAHTHTAHTQHTHSTHTHAHSTHTHTAHTHMTRGKEDAYHPPSR